MCCLWVYVCFVILSLCMCSVYYVPCSFPENFSTSIRVPSHTYMYVEIAFISKTVKTQDTYRIWSFVFVLKTFLSKTDLFSVNFRIHWNWDR